MPECMMVKATRVGSARDDTLRKMFVDDQDRMTVLEMGSKTGRETRSIKHVQKKTFKPQRKSEMIW